MIVPDILFLLHVPIAKAFQAVSCGGRSGKLYLYVPLQARM
jgi:hypothetical protein